MPGSAEALTRHGADGGGEGEDRPTDQLDDRADREELRRRYYGLLQELRVVLPGVQVLVAFQLTVPFAARFGELDDLGRVAYGVALVAGSVAVVLFTAPTVFHRVGNRTMRVARLQAGIRCLRIGICSMAVSIEAALLVVSRLIFGPAVAVVITAVVGSTMVLTWIVLPWRALPRRGTAPSPMRPDRP